MIKRKQADEKKHAKPKPAYVWFNEFVVVMQTIKSMNSKGLIAFMYDFIFGGKTKQLLSTFDCSVER